MMRIALKMLFGDRARYFGILLGLTFASLLITQQGAIFLGLMKRTYSFVDDTPQPDLWVVDPEQEHHADNKPMEDSKLYRVRGVEGVAWAVPMFRAWSKVKLPNGSNRACVIVGVDDATLMGAPEVVRGTLADLRQADSVLADEDEMGGKLAYKLGGREVPLAIGDVLELNDRRAVVAGTFRINRSFFWEPVVYTTYSRAQTFAPRERKTLQYVLVKAQPGQDLAELEERIERVTGLAAYSREAFGWRTAAYILDKTGIAVNFGIAVGLGFVIGVAIAGQTFYNFTVDNLKYFGALKAMGTGKWTLLGMVLTQSLAAGAIGFGLGAGGATLFGRMIANTDLAFYLPWQLLVLSAGSVLFICMVASVLSVRRVLALEPAVVFKA
jgi:putative ABC transport system permease protein